MQPTGSFTRLLLGTAVGDSLGLPAEGLSPQAIARRWSGPWRHRMLFGRGLVSDDTEHAVMVIQCLLQNREDAGKFSQLLARRLRWWLLCLPPGVGWATARAIFRLWRGIPPARSGVNSAGNGPAMRSAALGVCFARDPARLREFVRASTRLTHTDVRAEIAALAVALTAADAVNHPQDRPQPLSELVELWQSAGVGDQDWQDSIARLAGHGREGKSVAELAAAMSLQRGVSGYAYHSVPVALYAYYLHQGDFRKTVEALLNCGGDTDSTGAIAGALAALRTDIPREWVQGIVDWPVSVDCLRQVGAAADGTGVPPGVVRWLALPVRNFFALAVILCHAGRRLLPSQT